MKTSMLMLLLALGAAIKTNAQFIDLSTGKTVTLVKHNGTGMMYNTETQRPVYLYVNPTTKDTFYGRTQEIVNGKIVRNNGHYMYTGDEMYLYRDGEFRLKTEADSAGYKMKMKNDGDTKVKYGDYKRKIDQSGNAKIKDSASKAKLYNDGSLKIKDSTYRKKIDSDGNFREKDDSAKVKLKTDGSIKVKDKRENYKGKVDENGKVKEKDGNTKSKAKDGKEKTKTEAAKPNSIQ